MLTKKLILLLRPAGQIETKCPSKWVLDNKNVFYESILQYVSCLELIQIKSNQIKSNQTDKLSAHRFEEQRFSLDI